MQPYTQYATSSQFSGKSRPCRTPNPIKPLDRTPTFIELPGGRDITTLGPQPADNPPLLEPVVNRLAGLETHQLGRLRASQQILRRSCPGVPGNAHVRLSAFDEL